MERATYDLIVIGSGPAGEKGAAQAAYFDKKVALVEEAPSYGGAVANTGVPGKAMRETALYLSGLRQRDLHGLTLSYDGTLTVDRFMHRGRVVREALNQWIGANLDRHHVDVHRGRAAFVDAHTVAVKDEAGSRLLEAGVILIATGSTPYRPSTIPFGEPGVYDSDTILQMERLPRSLTIVGGGAIGCEYACLFKVLGLDEVRVINSGELILPFADEEISSMLREAMESLGIEFHTPDSVERVEAGPTLTLGLRSGKRLEAEALLVALGRRGNVAALRLENAGVRVNEQGQLLVNEHFQTNVPHIYAAGDVIGGPCRRRQWRRRGWRWSTPSISNTKRVSALSYRSGSGRSRRSRWWERPSRACARRRWLMSWGAGGTTPIRAACSSASAGGCSSFSFPGRASSCSACT